MRGRKAAAVVWAFLLCLQLGFCLVQITRLWEYGAAWILPGLFFSILSAFALGGLLEPKR